MEHEIQGHAIKAYKTAKNPALPFWHKVKEIGIEVAIIVFAVTLSIWLHDVSDHSHEQKDVRSFLTGLKKDLQSDLVQMQGDGESYDSAGIIFKYLTTPAPNFKLNPDTIKKYQNFIFNTTSFLPNSGRYEGFKSSGKLGNIENDTLQNDITELYQGLIPSVLASTNSYIQKKQALFDYINKNLKRHPNGTNNFLEVLSSDEAYNICNKLNYVGEIAGRYDKAIKKTKKIIKEIDAEDGR